MIWQRFFFLLFHIQTHTHTPMPMKHDIEYTCIFEDFILFSSLSLYGSFKNISIIEMKIFYIESLRGKITWYFSRLMHYCACCVQLNHMVIHVVLYVSTTHLNPTMKMYIVVCIPSFIDGFQIKCISVFTWSLSKISTVEYYKKSSFT